jgi:hypothetical protein
VVLGFEQGIMLARQARYHLSQSCFVLDIFEIGFHELFSWAGFEEL